MIATLAALLGCLNILCIVFLTVDRWVHRVTGKKSLEARLDDLERAMALMDVGTIKERLSAIDEHLRNTDKNVEKLERRRSDR